MCLCMYKYAEKRMRMQIIYSTKIPYYLRDGRDSYSASNGTSHKSLHEFPRDIIF